MAVVSDAGNLARGAMTHAANHPVMSMPGPMNASTTFSCQRLDLHRVTGASDRAETLAQAVNANFSAGTVKVEVRNLRPPAAGTPSVIGFDKNPADGPGQGAATHGASSGLMPCKPTGPARSAIGMVYTGRAPGETGQ
jgi:hypothetical protein